MTTYTPVAGLIGDRVKGGREGFTTRWFLRFWSDPSPIYDPRLNSSVESPWTELGQHVTTVEH